jgi:hypothetical protein
MQQQQQEAPNENMNFWRHPQGIMIKKQHRRSHNTHTPSSIEVDFGAHFLLCNNPHFAVVSNVVVRSIGEGQSFYLSTERTPISDTTDSSW